MVVVETDRAPASKFRWGELDEEDGSNLDFLLPPPAVEGPDENGVKRVISYRLDNDHNKVKVTTVTRVRNLAHSRLTKRAIERRSWAKFGDAANEDTSSRLTVVSTEEIFIERPTAAGTLEEAKAPAGLLPKGGGGHLKLCRTCGKKDDHWTAACPYKDLTKTDLPPPEIGGPSSGPPKGSAYVPPSKRGGGTEKVGDDPRRRNDENSVRVTNLSEDARQPDLEELFGTFGHVTRAHVALDRNTGASRGFGFVNFSNREDAERAIKKLNGYGYDNLILRVEWAEQRPSRD